MRSQTKIAAIFFLFTLSVMILLSVFVYFFIIRYSFADFYKRLEIRGIVTAKAQLDHEPAGAAVLQEVRRLHLEKLPEEKEYFYEIKAGKTFEKEAAELNLPVSFFQEIIRDGDATYQDDNTFFAGIKYQGKKGEYAVIVSADNYYNTHHLNYLRNIFLISIVVASLLSLVIAFFFSRQVLNPVKEITNQVKEISSQNLHLRLTPGRENDEINDLKRTFNDMLDRIETSFETQNNFISNASHELNTPLTTIIGETDLALAKERSKDEYKESLKVILNKAERLNEITSSLLSLAHTGFNGKIQRYEKIRADQLLWDVKRTIDKINPKNKVQLNLSLMPDDPEKLMLEGNEQLLHIAIINLLNNASKYSNNQPVTLSIGVFEKNVIIVIKDQGIGIPENELKYIYDPFFRASNTKSYEGYGIGLPLTRNIIRIHKGTLNISSKVQQGTTVEIILPVTQ